MNRIRGLESLRGIHLIDILTNKSLFRQNVNHLEPKYPQMISIKYINVYMLVI